jgi:hypothetical protein
MVLATLLTACTGKPVQNELAAKVNTNNFQPANLETSLMEHFVYSVNTRNQAALMDLFNESATFNMIDLVNVGTTLPQNNYTVSFTGKGEIEGWMELHVPTMGQLEPVEYTFEGNVVNLEALIIFDSQIQHIRLSAVTGDGKFNTLYLYYENIEYP